MRFCFCEKISEDLCKPYLEVAKPLMIDEVCADRRPRLSRQVNSMYDDMYDD